MAGLAQLLDTLAEGEVGRAGDAMHRVQMTAGDLDRFECLADGAERLDGEVVDAFRPDVLLIGGHAAIVAK